MLNFVYYPEDYFRYSRPGECTFSSAAHTTEGCRNATTNIFSLAGAGVAAGIGGATGGWFGAVIGVMAETAVSCLVGVVQTMYENCEVSYVVDAYSFD